MRYTIPLSIDSDKLGQAIDGYPAHGVEAIVLTVIKVCGEEGGLQVAHVEHRRMVRIQPHEVEIADGHFGARILEGHSLGPADQRAILIYHAAIVIVE